MWNQHARGRWIDNGDTAVAAAGVRSGGDGVQTDAHGTHLQHRRRRDHDAQRSIVWFVCLYCIVSFRSASVTNVFCLLQFLSTFTGYRRRKIVDTVGLNS